MYERQINLLKNIDYESIKEFKNNFNLLLCDTSFLNYLLLKLKDKDLYDIYLGLAFVIFSEKQKRNLYKLKEINFVEDYDYFQQYIYSWMRLFTKKIPRNEIIDLEQEGLALLKQLFEDGKLKDFKNDIRFKKFIKKNADRHEELRLKKGYDQLNELMDD